MARNKNNNSLLNSLNDGVMQQNEVLFDKEAKEFDESVTETPVVESVKVEDKVSDEANAHVEVAVEKAVAEPKKNLVRGRVLTRTKSGVVVLYQNHNYFVENVSANIGEYIDFEIK